MVFFFTHTPRYPLSEYIEYLWLFKDGQVSREESTLPSGTIELVVNLNENCESPPQICQVAILPIAPCRVRVDLEAA